VRSARILWCFVPAGAAAFALAFSGPALASHGGSSSSHGGSSSGNGPTTNAPAPAPAPSSGTLSVQGVVQSVSGSAVSVRLLDGTTSSVPYDRKTQVLVNGRTGRIADVRPGFVLAASWKAGKPAAMLRFVRPG
jgi:hypothetical protein